MQTPTNYTNFVIKNIGVCKMEPDKPLDEAAAQHIKELTWHYFRSNFKKKFQKQFSEQTFVVVASVSLYNALTGSTDIVSVGFGTKSLPQDVLTPDNKQDLLSDMHAEILALRRFRQFLLSQLSKQNSVYLTEPAHHNKRALKSHYKTILYCSQVFCGDCCISQNEHSFSGAKPVRYLNQPKYPDEKYQQNVLRTKPGRMDLPIHKRSAIMSCSDLIATANLVGIQGLRLFSSLKPIYLSTIVLDADQNCQQSINRGIDFVTRLSSLKGKPKKLLLRQIFSIVIEGKEKRISSQFRNHRPDLLILPKSGSRNKEGFELCGSIGMGGSDCEWINGKTGLPEGSSIKNYKTKGRVSRCCDSQLQTRFPSYKIRENQVFKCRAVLQRLKWLFGEWLESAFD